MTMQCGLARARSSLLTTYEPLTCSYSSALAKRSCWTRVTYRTSVLPMTLARLVVSSIGTPALAASALTDSGIMSDEGETKLSETE